MKPQWQSSHVFVRKKIILDHPQMEEDQQLMEEAIANTIGLSPGSAYTVLPENQSRTNFLFSGVPKLICSNQLQTRAEVPMEIFKWWDQASLQELCRRGYLAFPVQNDQSKEAKTIQSKSQLLMITVFGDAQSNLWTFWMTKKP